ncbi:hypothetical protein [Microcoleus sp. S13_C3]
MSVRCPSEEGRGEMPLKQWFQELVKNVAGHRARLLLLPSSFGYSYEKFI